MNHSRDAVEFSGHLGEHQVAANEARDCVVGIQSPVPLRWKVDCSLNFRCAGHCCLPPCGTVVDSENS